MSLERRLYIAQVERLITRSMLFPLTLLGIIVAPLAYFGIKKLAYHKCYGLALLEFKLEPNRKTGVKPRGAIQ